MLLDRPGHRQRLTRLGDDQTTRVVQGVEERVQPTDVVKQQKGDAGELALALLMLLQQGQGPMHTGLGRSGRARGEDDHARCLLLAQLLHQRRLDSVVARCQKQLTMLVEPGHPLRLADFVKHL
ncbi:hypothetical protein D3C76_1324610 [compost metagenome]